MSELWNGYVRENFEYDGRSAVLVFPKKANGRLALKTEYWGAFPEAAELSLLENGFHLCYVQNTNRWGAKDNLERQARFVRYLQEKYHLQEKIVPVGMSCGGLIAIKFAAMFPELVSCLYLDAPVVNYMSCPCGFGAGKVLNEEQPYREILDALDLETIGDLMAYRDMPLDNIPKLIENKIPVVMASGDSDTIVPYCENGVMLERAYRAAGLEIEVYIKPGGDHHPHGLPDPKPVVDFILNH